MKIVIIGAGGQAGVVCEILKHDRNVEIVGFIDPVLKEPNEKIMGLPILGDFSVLPELIRQGIKGYVVGIGDNKLRAQRFEEMKNVGLEPINAIHPTANIAHNVKIGKGTVVSIGATIATGAAIGNDVIINTGAIIEHDDIIEDNVHIGPGAVLAGRVTVKRGAFVGMRSAVKEYTTIGENATIGAGTVVLDDIPDNAVAVGIPAKVIKFNK
ncbi:transferase [candidate division WWE3 bacterium CG08_land_8_20_14_0_20_41_15]|uniref:Transferase n=1 Tax=candidate division WWE3 bacterium CG08_land_8_20_14_0_20_41_15 TaxID=1975086 RepID=A0A2H0X9G2_UNCKA|nr:MAG: transferase [candidate division WWE3 bacterium CG08_land_8_20_14_0_20_41_15]